MANLYDSYLVEAISYLLVYSLSYSHHVTN